MAYAPGSEPALFLGRGYTGHEHLPWFGLVNMNARLYDPALGRFLSPDPYVQMPDFTQNFNRYSYALNNPLMYVDEDGEFVHLIVGALIGGVANVVANWKTIKQHGFWTGLGYFGVGAAAGALSAGVGAGISSALVSGGSFSAGFLGTAAAKTAASSFISGAAIGAGSGGSGGFVTGFGNGLLSGKSFGQSLGQGAVFGATGIASGGLVGGLIGGVSAVIDGRRFTDGAKVTKSFVTEVDVVKVKQIGDQNCLPASGESVNKSLKGNLDQKQLRSLAGGNPQTDALPDGYFWEDIYQNNSGHTVTGKGGLTTSKLNDIIPTLKAGGRVTVGVEGVGNVGHSVVVKSVYLQTVEKVNGTITNTVMYRVMDPATGSFRTIPFNKIIGNVWHIIPDTIPISV
ncbi:MULTISPECIES: RHS repeat-associated core domain-containing protein [Proteiniphilum]|uniref:RHS repeat-associated core domain-containing protein n=1 Tax=Proteiniphilum TaxID=294702 RepID=UPI0028B1B138|nr:MULTISPECIES: RHS repeat-associated core domain-containing protein [Proteiniphilum]MDY9918285.1 RHS repeat-associated core domain-containing protein [Proteiniphilum sp.]